MSPLPTISGDTAVKALKRLGYEVDHQTGSHIILRCEFYPYRRVTVPRHRELKPGTLRAIIRQTGLSVEEFNQFLK